MPNKLIHELERLAVTKILILQPKNQYIRFVPQHSGICVWQESLNGDYHIGFRFRA